MKISGSAHVLFGEYAIIQYQMIGKFNNNTPYYEGGSESSVIGLITLLIDIIGCCIIP